MVLGVLPWLLRDLDRPEYASVRQAAISNDGLGWELAGTARLLLLLVVARFAFNGLLRRPTERLAQRRGGDEQHRDGRRLLEELWVTAGNLVMLAAALFVMLRRNGGCWFFDTAPCLAGWPNIPTSREVGWYYQLELAWYLHMLLKPLLKYGLPDGRDMLVHHVASLTLILVSYGTNLTRMGVVVLCLFAISNPLLHIAKICNQLSLGPLKIGGFVAFAAAFFLSRILLVPWAVLKPTMFDSRSVMPYAVEDFQTIYLAINTLLAALYAMQLLWMRGIVRVLRSAAKHGSAAASHMSARLDPAKRYVVGSDPRGMANGTANGGLHAAGEQRGGQANGARPDTPSPAEPPALAAAHHDDKNK